MKRNKGDKHLPIIGALVIIIILQGLFILINLPRRQKPAPLPVPAPVKPAVAVQGRIAIVLDDWGYNFNHLELARGISQPFTASLLPNLLFSRQAASELKRQGREVILHLPMEPLDASKLEKDTLMVAYDEAKIRAILSRDLASVAYAKGASNHMGSRATADAAVMIAVLKELKKRRMYFLDSFSTADSVAATLARSLEVGFARRDIFLDNQSDPAYIRGQLDKLKARAYRRGFAIGIGHDRKNTLEVLKEVMPEFERQGYKFVFVSELVR